MSWQERLRLAWEMPRLRRRQRNERLAIFFLMIGLVIYVLLAPLLNRGGDDRSQPSGPSRKGPQGPRRTGPPVQERR